MNHLSFETLNLFLDRQLAPSERDDAQVHLAACAKCRAELAALERVSAALASVTPERLPGDLAPRVLAQIAPARRARWVTALVVAETAAAIALTLWLSETLAPLFDWLPDFGGMLFALQQIVSVALNAINIEPLQEIAPTEWLIFGAATIAAWLIANRLLIQFPQKEVVV
jgi:anti-sigma factor RsiW